MSNNVVGEMGGNWLTGAITPECDRQDEDAIAGATLNALADRLSAIIRSSIAEYNQRPEWKGRPSVQIRVMEKLTEALQERDGVAQI